MVVSSGPGRFAVQQVLKESPERSIWLATDPFLSGQLGVVRLVRRGRESGRRLTRFRSECAHLAQLRHPNIAAGLDFGEIDSGPYLFSEYVAGAPLAARREMPWGPVLTQVLRGLHYLHENGVVHGDLKPHDLLLHPGTDPDHFDALRLIDYGMCEAKPASLPHQAPEIFFGDLPSPAADFYGLGVILYQWLKGDLPFPSPGSDPSRLLKTKLDKRWHRDFCQCLAKEGGLAEVAAALMNFAPEGRPAHAGQILKMVSGVLRESLSLAAPTDYYERLHRAKFSGRNDFCEEALAHLEQGRSVWIWGPRGRGKSRILEELRWVVEVKGWPSCFIRGRCEATRTLHQGLGHKPLIVFWDGYPDAHHPPPLAGSSILYCLSSRLPPVPASGWSGLEIPVWRRHEMEGFLAEAIPHFPIDPHAKDQIHRLTKGHPGDAVVLLQVLYDRSHGLGLASPQLFRNMEEVYAERNGQLASLERFIVELCGKTRTPLDEPTAIRLARRPAEEVRRALDRLATNGFILRHLDREEVRYTLVPDLCTEEQDR